MVRDNVTGELVQTSKFGDINWISVLSIPINLEEVLMMNDVVKEKYSDKAIRYGNMRLYFIKTAKEVITDCKKSNIKVMGLEAFKLTGEGIQPSQAHSVDFNANEESWQKAIEFLENVEDLTYLYEIWYEGY